MCGRPFLTLPNGRVFNGQGVNLSRMDPMPLNTQPKKPTDFSVKRKYHQEGTKRFHFPDAFEIDRVSSSRFRTVNGAELYNRTVVARCVREHEVVTLKGYTVFGDFHFKFPVLCSFREIVRFLHAMQEWPSKERRMLFLEGELSSSIAIAFPLVFGLAKNEWLDTLFVGAVGVPLLRIRDEKFSDGMLYSFLKKPVNLDPGSIFRSRPLSYLLYERYSGQAVALFVLSLFDARFTYPAIACFLATFVVQYTSEMYHARFDEVFNLVASLLFWGFTDPVVAVSVSVVCVAQAQIILRYGPDVVVYYIAPFSEELAKEIIPGFGVGLGFMEIYEKFRRYRSFSPFFFVLAIIAPLGHVVSHLFSWQVRLAVHILWNFVVFKLARRVELMGTGLAFQEEMETIEEICFATDLFRKIYHSDWTGIGLSVGMKASYFNNLYQIVQLQNIEELKDHVSFEHLENEEEGATMMLSGGFSSLLDELLPEGISKSPTTRKILALVVVLFSANFVGDSFLVKQFSHYVDFSNVGTGSDILSIAIAGFRSVMAGLTRFAASGSWKDLFEVPGYVKFVRDASELLMDSGAIDTKEQILAKIARARNLIASQEYRTSTPDSSRLVQKLRDYVVERGEAVDAHKSRLQPMVIWINGVSGFGKTIVLNSLINMLTKAHGLERFTGDVIKYNIEDKYPASTCAHPKARFVLLNDLRSDFTGFPKESKMPIDVVLQQGLDTYPYSIPSAAIEDKKRVFNDILYFIITSNNMNFVCPGETEKLQRRLEDGVLVSATLAKGGKNAKFKDLSGATQALRNDAMKFNVSNVLCAGKYITFSDSEVNVGLKSFFDYVADRSAIHFDKARSDYDKFENPANICGCGIAKVLHMSVVNEAELFVPRTKDCLESAREFELTLLSEDYFVDVRSAVWGAIFWAVFFTVFGFGMDVTRGLWEAIVYKYVAALDNALSQHPTFWNAVTDLSSRTSGHEARMMILRFKRFHTKVDLFVRRHRKKLALFVSVAFGAAIYAYMRPKSSVLGNAIMSHQVDPESMKVVEFKREINYDAPTARKWNKSEEELKFVELKTYGVGFEDLVKKVRNQIVKSFVRTPIGDKTFRLNCLVVILNCEWVMINRHYLQRDKNPMFSNFTLTVDDIESAYTDADVRIIPGREYVLLKNYFRPHASPLHKFFAEKIDATAMDVTIINPDWTLDSVASPSSFISEHDGLHYQSYQWQQAGEVGFCGSVFIGRGKQGCFFGGIICYGKKSWGGQYVGGCTITQAEYKALCGAEETPTVDTHMLGCMPVEVLSMRSELRSINSPFVSPIGSLPGPTRTFHSTIKKSRFYDEVAPLLDCEFAPPGKLRGLTDAQEWASCFTTTFKNVNLMNTSTESLRVRAMRQYLADVTPEGVIHSYKLRPLELSEAVFGCPAMGISRVEFKTSLGRKLRDMGLRNKYDLFQESGDRLIMLQSFRDDVAKLLEELGLSCLRQVNIDFSPKDEVRPREKIDAYKIRLFSVLDFHYNVVFRMYVMPLITYLLDHPFLSECFGQMNAGSKQWTELAAYLTALGTRVFDMDFSTFDGSHDNPMFKIVAFFFYSLSLKLGYLQQEAEIVYMLFNTLCLQVLFYMNDVAIKLKGMPSGVIVTLILNSVVNSILMRMAFAVLVTDVDLSEFKNHVHAATVGDDNGSGVSDRVFEQFNMITIAPLYHSWGYVATPVFKSGEFQKVMELSDLTFVKRKFVQGEFGYYLAPLEKNSILKPLCFEDEDIGVPSAQRLVDVARGCQREAFLHGRVYFDWMQDFLKGLFSKHQMSAVLVLLDYSTLVSEFLDGSFKTFAC